jgi:hypothetical protein
MMRKPHFTLVPLFLASAACGQDAPFDLEIKGEALRVGRSLHVRVAESDGDALIENESFPVNRDPLSVTYGDLLAEGVSYRIDLFLDLDDDGNCSPPRDRVWTTDTRPIDDAFVLDLGKLAQDPSACSSF